MRQETLQSPFEFPKRVNTGLLVIQMTNLPESKLGEGLLAAIRAGQ